MGQLFIVHFFGISTINIPPGRQFQFVYAEDTKFTANIHTAFQCRTSRRRRSSRFIPSGQCSCISTTTTGKSLARFIFHEIYLNDAQKRQVNVIQAQCYTRTNNSNCVSKMNQVRQCDGIIDKVLYNFLAGGLTDISLQFPLRISNDTFLTYWGVKIWHTLSKSGICLHLFTSVFNEESNKLISSANWIFGYDKIKLHFHVCFDCNPIIDPITHFTLGLSGKMQIENDWLASKGEI